MEYLIRYVNEFIHLSMEMAPWLLIGFLFAGILHVYMPEGSVRRIMGGKNVKSVVYAAILGIPLPLCSCGVIPTGISFYKEGAAKGATVSFLISTPQTGVDSILATYSLLGLPFALLRPVVAFFSGILGGITTNLTDTSSKEPIQSNDNLSEEARNKAGKFMTMINYAFYEFLMDIAKWLLVGLGIAALISMLLPEDFFTSYIQNELLSMFIVLLASIPIYVCATGSIPIAAVLIMKGLSPGAALVFLMAGPATNAATMAVIGKAIDKKTLVIYMGTIISSAIFFGYLTNLLLPREWFTKMPGMMMNHEHELIPLWLQLVSAIILGGLILMGYIRKYTTKKNNQAPIIMDNQLKNIKVKVGGMTCNHCKANVEKNLLKLAGIETVIANPETLEVHIQGNAPDVDKIRDTVEDIGYEFGGTL